MFAITLNNSFPTTWVGFLSACSVVGLFIGGVIAYYSTRNERKKMREAHSETNRVYEQTIKAQKDFINTVNTTHIAQIKLLQDNFNKSMVVMTEERDSYRTKTHNLAGELHACGLRIKEFELRPDLTTLYHSEKEWHEQREEFYTKMFESQQGILKAQQDILVILQNMVATTNTLATTTEKPQ